MAAGLGVGLGERDTDSVFRRSFSALILGECIARDNGFASPNGGIASSTRDCNGEPIRYGVTNYASRGDCESQWRCSA